MSLTLGFQINQSRGNIIRLDLEYIFIIFSDQTIYSTLTQYTQARASFFHFQRETFYNGKNACIEEEEEKENWKKYHLSHYNAD